MIQVKNIREFTAAVSQFLLEQGIEFTSTFNRMQGMLFTFSKKVEFNIIQVQVVGGETKQFKANLLANSEPIYSLEADPNEDFEKQLKAMLKKFKGFQNKITKNSES